MKSATASDLADRLALLPSAFVTVGSPTRPVERLIGLQSALAKLPDLVTGLSEVAYAAAQHPEASPPTLLMPGQGLLYSVMPAKRRARARTSA